MSTMQIASEETLRAGRRIVEQYGSWSAAIAKGERRDDGGRDSAQERRQAERGVERRSDIGTEAHIQGMTERKNPGESHHHVPGDAEIGVVQDQDEHGQRIGADRGRRDQQQGEEDAEKRAGLHVRFPISPSGRSSSTRIRSVVPIRKMSTRSSPNICRMGAWLSG